MSAYKIQQESHRDAMDMERVSILATDDEYEDDGLWPCSGQGGKCENLVEKDGDYCEDCQADIEYYANDNLD